MFPSGLGSLVQETWLDVPNHFPQTALDEFVLMPNHFHGIILITKHEKGTACCAPTFGKPVPHSLPTIMRSFKSMVSKRIHEKQGTSRGRIWQRNYFERVVRNEKELTRMREYILNNPVQWGLDRENPTTRFKGSVSISEPWEIDPEIRKR